MQTGEARLAVDGEEIEVGVESGENGVLLPELDEISRGRRKEMRPASVRRAASVALDSSAASERCRLVCATDPYSPASLNVDFSSPNPRAAISATLSTAPLSSLPYPSHVVSQLASNPSGTTLGMWRDAYSDGYGGVLPMRQKKRHLGSEKDEVRSSGRSEASRDLRRRRKEGGSVSWT